MSLLAAERISVSFGGVQAVQDLSFAVAFLETHGPEFAELWDKYQTPGATAYWPRLTPNYFSVSIDEVVTRMHTHEARRGALQHRSDEPE